jgi:hypothetical protein
VRGYNLAASPYVHCMHGDMMKDAFSTDDSAYVEEPEKAPSVKLVNGSIEGNRLRVAVSLRPPMAL